MAAKIVKYSLVVIALLVQFSVVVAYEYPTEQTLIGLFESALTNDSYTLWQLRQIYFNPDSNQSPGQVCLSVTIYVDTIAADPSRSCTDQNGPGFDRRSDGFLVGSSLHIMNFNYM